jgi:hypothetical protein
MRSGTASTISSAPVTATATEPTSRHSPLAPRGAMVSLA